MVHECSLASVASRMPSRRVREYVAQRQSGLLLGPAAWPDDVQWVPRLFPQQPHYFCG